MSQIDIERQLGVSAVAMNSWNCFWSAASSAAASSLQSSNCITIAGCACFVPDFEP